MAERVAFSLRRRNPDVLTCIANLSNDEVFTPPEFANAMLDTLAGQWAAANHGADLWSDKTVTFLDPVTKTGVFLREITKRLVEGLEEDISDLEDRVDHILTKQVFGIGITRLTSLLARRTAYCSKDGTGPHSVARSFGDADGNIWFERVEHSWADGRCRYCGASQKALDRGHDFESHAYAFIHTDDIRARVAELFGGDMQFDVIIGNDDLVPHNLKRLETGRAACAALGCSPGEPNRSRNRTATTRTDAARSAAGGASRATTAGLPQSRRHDDRSARPSGHLGRRNNRRRALHTDEQPIGRELLDRDRTKSRCVEPAGF